MKRTFLSIAALAVVALGACLAVMGIAHNPAAGANVLAALDFVTSDAAHGSYAAIGIGGLVINATNLRNLQIAFNSAFKGAFSAAKPLWNQVATLVPSTTGAEEYAWLGMTTGFREWLGDRVIQNLRTHGYTIKNKTFENTVGVKREDIEDDQYGVYTPMIAQLGQDAAMHPDELVFAAITAGDAQLCYDGQNFFDTDHPVGKPGSEVSVSNHGGGAGAAWYLLDTSKVIKPILFQKRRDYNFVAKTSLSDDNVFFQNEFVWGSDARVNVGYGLWQMAYLSKQTLDETNYGAAFAAMTAFKSDAGKPLNVKPDIVLVGPSNWDKALKVVQAETLANGASNVYRNTTKVVLCPWLT